MVCSVYVGLGGGFEWILNRFFFLGWEIVCIVLGRKSVLFYFWSEIMINEFV